MQTTLPHPTEALILAFAPLSPVPGRADLLAHQAADFFRLWQTWEDECGEKQDIPFWAHVWPAAQMMAEHIGKHPGMVAGKRVLDFGCGCGVAGIAAAKAGAAHVTANDIDPIALDFTARNARANGCCVAVEANDLLGTLPDPAWDVILVADLFYEKSVSEAMLDWLAKARANGSAVFIADANRPFSPRTGIRILLEKTYATDADLEGSSERTVRLLAYLP